MLKIQEKPQSPAPTVPSYMHRKQIIDRILACLLLVPGLPLLGFLILLVRATSKGPAIYRQTRVGKDGKWFTLYKLRSMRVDAEDGTGPVWSPGEDDPRVTRIGKILRATHLDELPQLFNVLKGEMAVVGPRPERPEIVDVLVDEVPGYLDRLVVTPGVTGLAQINLPPDTDFESVRKKLIVDMDYINHGSFWMDARITSCTLLRVFRLPTQQVRRLMALERVPSDEVAPNTKPVVAPVSVAQTVEC